MSSMVSAIKSKLAIGVIVPVVLALAGCGKSWDGHYEPVGYRPGEVVLEVGGSKAVRSIYKYGSLMTAKEFTVEQKSDKVIFSETRGNKTSYVFALAADDRGLKCISESCDRFGSPLKEEWTRVDNK